MAGATRLELATSGVTGRRSNQTELRPPVFLRVYLRKYWDSDSIQRPSRLLKREVLTKLNYAPDAVWWAEQGLNL